MSTATTPVNTAGAASAEGPLIRSSFGLVAMLIVEFVLGTAQNLYGTTPTTAHHIQIFSSALLGIHFVWGVLMVIAAIVLLVQAFRAKNRLAIITSVVGLLALVAAAGSGSDYTQDGNNGASFTMTIGAAVALFSYSLNLRFLNKGN